ncbi:hypothetical protein YQE_00647, partial [Dendroctonus ponderosae]
MDNAGSFDDLIPLLPKYFYICIDLPGHGQSDPFPPILPIHSADYLLAIRVVVDYFQRDKYIYMGHSYGGQMGEDSKILRSFLLPVLEHLKRQKCVKIVYMKGDHDVHQVSPERVAPFVCEFLNYNKSKL